MMTCIRVNKVIRERKEPRAEASEILENAAALDTANCWLTRFWQLMAAKRSEAADSPLFPVMTSVDLAEPILWDRPATQRTCFLKRLAYLTNEGNLVYAGAGEEELSKDPERTNAASYYVLEPEVLRAQVLEIISGLERRFSVYEVMNTFENRFPQLEGMMDVNRWRRIMRNLVAESLVYAVSGTEYQLLM